VKKSNFIREKKGEEGRRRKVYVNAVV